MTASLTPEEEGASLAAALVETLRRRIVDPESERNLAMLIGRRVRQARADALRDAVALVRGRAASWRARSPYMQSDRPDERELEAESIAAALERLARLAAGEPPP
jgi:hypothetical protein